MSRPDRVVFIAVGLIATGIAVYGFNKTCTSRGAHNALKTAILETLKSPSSAVFGRATKIERPFGCYYKISGVVDAQNSYGAMIRHRYSGNVLGREYTVIDFSVQD